jgi:Phage tail lysozyme
MMRSLTPGLVELDSWLNAKQPEIVAGIKDIGKAVTTITDAIKYIGQLDEESKNWTLMKLLNSAANPNGAGSIKAPLPTDIVTDHAPTAGAWGAIGNWIKGAFSGGRQPRSSSANAFDQPTRGLSIGGKEISLERAEDGGSNGTAFGNGATRGIEVNGTKVGPGNPLPVTLDNFGFGGADGGGGGLLGAIGAGVSRLFGGGGSGGGGSDSYGAGSSHVPKAEGVKRAAHLVDHLMSKFGLTREQAIGATGVMGYESGDFTAMQEGGQAPGHGGWGYAQWTGPRRRNFMNWFKQSGIKDPSSVEANEGFLDYELTHGYGRAINAIKKQHGVAESALSWEHVFEDMDGTAGIPAFGAHVARAVAYSKLPQLQPGYFATSPGGNNDHSVTHNVVNHKTDVHVDGSMDPETTARMVGSHIHRTNQDLTRDMIGATQ